MNILVLGGNRFVGKALTEKLLEDNKVTVFNRKGTGPEGATIIKGDRNLVQGLKSIPFNSFDLIIDFCLFKPHQFELMKRFIPEAKKYIFISSASVGRPKWGAYGTEKEECEALVKRHFNDYYIVRPPYIDGQNSHRPRIAQIINQIENNEPVTIDGDGQYSINVVWVDDVVNFLYELYSKDVLGNITTEIGTSINYTMNEYVDVIASLMETKAEIEEGKPFWAPANELVVRLNDHTDKFKPLWTKFDAYKTWYDEIGKEKYGYK